MEDRVKSLKMIKRTSTHTHIHKTKESEGNVFLMWININMWSICVYFEGLSAPPHLHSSDGRARLQQDVPEEPTSTGLQNHFRCAQVRIKLNHVSHHTILVPDYALFCIKDVPLSHYSVHWLIMDFPLTHQLINQHFVLNPVGIQQMADVCVNYR